MSPLYTSFIVRVQNSVFSGVPADPNPKLVHAPSQSSSGVKVGVGLLLVHLAKKGLKKGTGSQHPLERESADSLSREVPRSRRP